MRTSSWIIGCFNTEGRCLKCYRSGNNRQSGKSVNSFYEDQKGRLWILETRGGLLCYDLGQSRFYRVPWDGYDPIEMLEDTVHHCYWIGTWNDGVVRLDEAGNGNRFPALRSAQSVTPRFNALDVCLSADCRTLFTTDMSMLRQWHIRPDGTLEEDLSIRQQLPPGRHILDKMDLDREGNVWVASYMPHTFILSSEQQRKEVATIPDLSLGTCTSEQNGEMPVGKWSLAGTGKRALPCLAGKQGFASGTGDPDALGGKHLFDLGFR